MGVAEFRHELTNVSLFFPDGEKTERDIVSASQPAIQRCVKETRSAKVGEEENYILNCWDTKRAWNENLERAMQLSEKWKGTHFSQWLLAECRGEKSSKPPNNALSYFAPCPQTCVAPPIPEFALIGREINFPTVYLDGLAALRDGTLVCVEIKGPGDNRADREFVERPIAQALYGAIAMYVNRNRIVNICQERPSVKWASDAWRPPIPNASVDKPVSCLVLLEHDALYWSRGNEDTTRRLVQCWLHACHAESVLINGLGVVSVNWDWKRSCDLSEHFQSKRNFWIPYEPEAIA